MGVSKWSSQLKLRSVPAKILIDDWYVPSVMILWTSVPFLGGDIVFCRQFDTFLLVVGAPCGHLLLGSAIQFTTNKYCHFKVSSTFSPRNRFVPALPNT